MSYDDIMGLPSHLRPMPDDTPSAAVRRRERAQEVILAVFGTGYVVSEETTAKIEKALFDAEIDGKTLQSLRLQPMMTDSADVAQVVVLAKALLNAGMDVDTLLSRMMGLK